MTSETYRRSSSNAGAAQASLEKDPNNHLYWRMNPRRMESQLVHDSLLQLSGTLDLTMGGPSMKYEKAGKRRSLYFTHSPDAIDPFLKTFDDADLLQCYRRSESVVPQQALALSNSKIALENSRLIADQSESTQKRMCLSSRPFARYWRGIPVSSRFRNVCSSQRVESLVRTNPGGG